MTTEPNDIITVDDVEYNVNDMTDQQKYAVNQLRALNNKILNAQFELDQLRAAQNMFSQSLTTLLKTQAEGAVEDGKSGTED
jgi:hypothetical protein